MTRIDLDWLRPSVATQLPARWVRPFWFMMGILFATLMITTWPAHASPCMTFHQARELHPNEYLRWRGEHCWYAGERHKHSVAVKIPRERPETAAPRLDVDWSMVADWWIDSEAIRTDMRDAMLMKAARYRLAIMRAER